MKITQHETQAQQNAHWYGKKPPRGSWYRPKRQMSDTTKTFLLAVTMAVILAVVYLIRTA